MNFLSWFPVPTRCRRFLDNDRTSLGWIWLIVPSETASLPPQQNGKKNSNTNQKNAPKKRTSPPELLVPIDPGVSLPLIHADSLRCFTGSWKYNFHKEKQQMNHYTKLQLSFVEQSGGLAKFSRFVKNIPARSRWSSDQCLTTECEFLGVGASVQREVIT